jgi:hypothetical protein
VPAGEIAAGDALEVVVLEVSLPSRKRFYGREYLIGAYGSSLIFDFPKKTRDFFDLRLDARIIAGNL